MKYEDERNFKLRKILGNVVNKLVIQIFTHFQRKTMAQEDKLNYVKCFLNFAET